MSITDLPYISGKGEGNGGPLGRYLPPVPPGVLTTWLGLNVPQGSWILDPFGISPRLAIEAARAGYRVMVAVNNPITRFMLEIMASGAQKDDYRAVLAELAATRKGEERLEIHIQSLYETQCDRCHRPVQAEAFLWERHAETPYARLYTCPYCGESGEGPITETDQARLANLPPASLHRARALERVVATEDPTRPDVEAAIDCYLARSLYVIFTLINKLESSSFSDSRRALLTALLLSVMDDANTLWPHPTGRSRPRQLAIPPHFRENNLWLSLEQAADKWAETAQPIPLATWPEQAPAGGITLLQGRFREYASSLNGFPIQAFATAFPRPNQAYWTLSALWTGWLWGRESVAPLKGALTRRRYDWNWHASALQSTLWSLSCLFKEKTPLFGLIAEAEPSFVTSVLLAAGTSRFKMNGIALRGEHAMVQVHLQVEREQVRAPMAPVEAISKWAIQNYLTERGEPSLYLPSYLAAVAALARESAFQLTNQQTPADILPLVQGSLKRTFADRTIFVRYGGNESAPETGYWWLREPTDAAEPLMDRIEIETVRYLQKHPGSSFAEIDQHLCNQLPGLATPNLELVLACLESYGKQDPPEDGLWTLRDEDRPEARRQDIKTMREMLHEIGVKLGYLPEGQAPVIWKDVEGQIHSVYYITVSSLIGRCIHQNDYDPQRCFIVLPGSRSNLVSFKLRRNPCLAQVINAGWGFLKFRLLRDLVENPGLDIGAWTESISRDPLEYKAAPIEMFVNL